jgi:hypothetical protein
MPSTSQNVLTKWSRISGDIMKNLLLLFALLSSVATAQSKLPACQGKIPTWNMCVGGATWSDGSKYFGEFKEGKRNGQGTHTYANGDKYIGEYKNDTCDGQGTLTYANGDKYVGEFQRCKRWGNGTFISSDGTKKFTGHFIDGFHRGVLEINGRKFEGRFKDDELDGHGIFTFSDLKIVGHFKKGKLNGLGSSSLFPNQKNEVLSIGEFKNGLLEGKGIRRYGADPIMGLYVGDFKDGSPDGAGKEDTSIFSYVGNFKQGQYDGQGVLDWGGSEQYVGTFKKGNYEGHGVLTRGSFKYEGEFKNGKPHGQGTQSEYAGLFSNGQLSLYGDAEPRNIRTGLWADGIFIKVVTPLVVTKKTDTQSLAEKAKQGDADAQYRYGMTFILGDGDELKPRVAIEWLMKAQAQGHESAKKQIVSMYDLGVQMSTIPSSIQVRN